VHGCESVTKRVPARLEEALAIAAVAAVLLSGCSPEVGFPAVHDMPAPRAEAPLTPDQIKQATDELANERDHLSAATQAGSKASSTATTKKAAADARKKPLVTTPSVARAAPSTVGQAAAGDAKP
jgi:hypothetical protein